VVFHRSLIVAVVAVVALAALAPSAHAGAQPAPLRVGSDAATVRAKLPRDLPPRVRYRFVWRSAGGAWHRTPSRRRARGARVVSARLGGLRPATTYEYRVVAGRTRGLERRFRTRPAPAGGAPLAQPGAGAAGAPTRTAELAPDAEREPDRRPDDQADPVLPGGAPSPGAPEPPGPASATNLNPGTVEEMPDPMVLRDGDTYWAYATGDRFPVMRSTDLVTWTPAGRALETRPSWAVADPDWHPWAPSVLRRDAPCPGEPAGPCFVLFHTALSAAAGPTTHCVGVATATAPQGPFEERGILRDAGGALVGCGDAGGLGNIDPAPFVDADGRVYLYVSTDMACAPQGCELEPTLSVIPLEAGALTAAGPRQPLFAGRPGTWEQAPWAPVVENPWVVRRGSTYHLLYSGGAFDGAYAMGHATAPSPLGPFVRSSPEPILQGNDEVAGPGGGVTVSGGGGADWLLYHGRTTGWWAARAMRIDPIAWHGDGTPAVAGPSTARVTLP
jgi:hypothetical protein